MSTTARPYPRHRVRAYPVVARRVERRNLLLLGRIPGAGLGRREVGRASCLHQVRSIRSYPFLRRQLRESARTLTGPGATTLGLEPSSIPRTLPPALLSHGGDGEHETARDALWEDGGVPEGGFDKRRWSEAGLATLRPVPVGSEGCAESGGVGAPAKQVSPPRGLAPSHSGSGSARGVNAESKLDWTTLHPRQHRPQYNQPTYVPCSHT